jgi:hypothetical protein
MEQPPAKPTKMLKGPSRYFPATEQVTQADEELYHALEGFDPEELRSALAAGANPNRAQQHGDTPLHIVATGFIRAGEGSFMRSVLRDPRTLEMLNILLAHGADPLVNNNQGSNPIHLLEELLTYLRSLPQDDPDREQAILRLEQMIPMLNGAILTSLQAKSRVITRPAQQGYLGRLPQPLREEIARYTVGPLAVDVNISKKESTEKLINAIKTGNLQNIAALARNADADATTQNGTPIIFLAALWRDPQQALLMVQQLLGRVINLNPTNANGQTLLDVLYALPDRQNIINVIEQTMRNRGQLVIPRARPEAPRTQGGWLSGLFGSSK